MSLAEALRHTATEKLTVDNASVLQPLQFQMNEILKTTNVLGIKSTEGQVRKRRVSFLVNVIATTRFCGTRSGTSAHFIIV